MSLALLAALAALVVYLRTMLPDIGGYEDTPKFQYLGAVLGTAHAPGYPLHTVLSYLFTLLPVGNPAYRVGLLSAVSAAATVGLVVLTVRALGCRRPAAIFASLTLGFGFAFWTFAVLAEVYSLAALLLLAVLYWLVRWHHSGRLLHLMAASASFALALGNHPTVGVTAPAIALFVLASPQRRTLTVRSMAAAFAVAASGFVQYTYLAIRTFQQAPFVEARVGSVGDFVGLFRQDRYESFLLPFTWDTFWSSALPNLANQARLEFGLVGLIVIVLGVWVLGRRDWRVSTLFGLSAIATMGLMIHFLGYQQGFLVPAWTLVAVYLAVGADEIHRRLAALPGTAWASIVAVMLVGYPALPLGSNFATNDWSRRTTDARFMRAVVAELPSPAALVREGYVVDSMLQYLEAVEGGEVWRQLRRLPPDPAAIQRLHDQGTPVYAFGEGQTRLAAYGFDFARVPVPGPTLAERLRAVPPGATVAIAGRHTPLPADVVDALGLGGHAEFQWPRSYTTVVVTIGGTSSDVRTAGEPVRATVQVGDSTPGGTRPLTAEAGPDGAFVSLGDQAVVGVTDGLAVVIVDPSGARAEIHTPQPPAYQIAPDAPYQLFRLAAVLPSLPVGGGVWTDMTAAVHAGTVDLLVNNYRAFDAEVVMYAAAPTPMAPALDHRFSGPARPTFHAHVFDRDQSDSRAALEHWLALDGLAPARLGPSRFVARMRQSVNDGGDSAGWGLSLGALPEVVLIKGTTDLVNAQRVLATMPAGRRFPGPTHLALVNASGAFDWMFGPGWHAAEPDRDGELRWSASEAASIVLPIDEVSDLRLTLTLRLRRAADPDDNQVGLRVNGYRLDPCTMPSGWQTCTWPVPARLLRAGGNLVTFESPSIGPPLDAAATGDTRHIGVALRQIRISRTAGSPLWTTSVRQ
ncbi:MAG TPA: DUF2723 domain-containing protein [Vicinamibacterales bacterium]|nr:DUF2723 domain-containing protein [Vicinamibacterales bacterium]